MSDVVVRPVRSRSERKQFLHYPWRQYRGDPYWIPPLRLDQKELVNYKRHPFYDHAEIETFLATRDGRPCGRVAAIVNHGHNERFEEKRGFFGFFESVEDQRVADALFDAARDWLAAQGMKAIRGPANPSLNYECGLLVEGFDSSPFFMMTYNPPYYGQLIENYGFAKAQDLYAYWGHVEMLDTLDEKLAFVTEAARERFSIHVRPLDKKRFRREVESFLDIYNKSMAGTWGFVPLSADEIRHLAAGLRHLIVPELALMAEVDGKPIGACFGLLDYNPRIREIDGKLFPFGFLKLVTNRRAIKKVRLIATNVVPEYQRWGVGLVLLSGLVPHVRAWGIEEAEFSWVLESNQLSRGSLERGGAKRSKTYRLYDMAI